MTNGDATDDSNEANTIDIKLSYTIFQSNTWSSTVSAKLGVKTSIEASIPLIAKGQIEISGEFCGSYTWGETKSISSVIETTYKVNVPTMTRVRVSLQATQGHCEVPYSYTQRGTLMNGDQVTNKLRCWNLCCR